MIKLLIIFAIAFSSHAFADAQTVKVTVKGMVCAFCAQGIVKNFKSDSSVDKVDVSLEKQLVTVTLKDGKDLDDKKVSEFVTYAGYDLVKIERQK